MATTRKRRKDAPRPPIVSQRDDGLGHWPRGKRRSAIDEQTATAVRARLQAQVERGRSRRELADLLEVSEKTVRRWLSGEDHPAPQLAALVLRKF